MTCQDADAGTTWHIDAAHQPNTSASIRGPSSRRLPACSRPTHRLQLLTTAMRSQRSLIQTRPVSQSTSMHDISISRSHEYQAAGRTAVASENDRAGILDNDSCIDPLRQIALSSEPSGTSRPEDSTICHNGLRSGEPQ